MEAASSEAKNATAPARSERVRGGRRRRSLRRSQPGLKDSGVGREEGFGELVSCAQVTNVNVNFG
jgi:hypothetical protein